MIVGLPQLFLEASFAANDNYASAKQIDAIDAAIGAVSNPMRVHHFSDVDGDATINGEELDEALTEVSKNSTETGDMLICTDVGRG